MRDHHFPYNRPYSEPAESTYDPLRAPIERARNNPDCEQARADLAAFTHQPEPERKRRDHGWAIVAAAVVIVAVVVAGQHWL